jgi:hypothetical protein
MNQRSQKYEHAFILRVKISPVDYAAGRVAVVAPGRRGSDFSHRHCWRRAADHPRGIADIRARMNALRFARCHALAASFACAAGLVASASAGEVTSSAADPRLEACRIRMTAPAKHEWTTWWDPKGVALSGEGPSSVHSSHWASRKEQKTLDANKSAMPLDINCSNDGPPEILVSLAAFSSTEKDVPLGPGTYPIVGKSSGEVKPGQILAGSLTYNKGMYDARSGTLELERFDKEGVAGSFVIEGVEELGGRRRIHIEGTFEIPCRGGMLQTDCMANKSRAVTD